MSGSPVTGAVPVARCKWCKRVIVPCTMGGRCIGLFSVHLMTRLHSCGNGLTVAWPAGKRGAA